MKVSAEALRKTRQARQVRHNVTQTNRAPAQLSSRVCAIAAVLAASSLVATATAAAAAADSKPSTPPQQAKLHYVEIGQSLKGDYKFGYDTGSGPSGQSFREETRLDDGTVKGAYGYVDANGKQKSKCTIFLASLYEASVQRV